MPNKHDLSHELVKVPVGETKLNVLQNISDQPVQWTPRKGSLHFYYLRPGDFLKVNYDVWVKSDTHGASHLVAGSFPGSYIPVYREGVVKNKTYVHHKAAIPDVDENLSVIEEFPELTIQKNKSIKISLRAFAYLKQASLNGVVIQTSIKVNGVDHVLCDSDRMMASGTDAVTFQAYNKILFVDLITLGIVPDAVTDYTIRVKFSAKAASTLAVLNASTSHMNNAALPPQGALLASARNQNNFSVIVEELER